MKEFEDFLVEAVVLQLTAAHGYCHHFEGSIVRHFTILQYSGVTFRPLAERT